MNIKIFYVHNEIVYCRSEKKIGWVANIKLPSDAPQCGSTVAKVRTRRDVQYSVK